MIESLQQKHAAQIAQLHIAGIPTGFISSLGPKFVTCLYEAIASSPNAFGYVHLENEQILGFVAFTENLRQLYCSVCKKAGFRFFLILLFEIFSWKKIKRILETLFYPKRIEKQNLPDAELLSIVVSDSARGKGIGRNLMQRGLEECAKRKINQVKVLVADFNKPANELYKKAGFQLITRIDSHGIMSNIYVIFTDYYDEQ